MPDGNALDLDPIDKKTSELRGSRGSVFAVATDSEKEYYVNLLDSGTPDAEAFDKLAEMVARRFARATGTYKSARNQ